jgi:hypothetical protein
MYTKSFSTLRCCGWAYGCIIIAVICVQVGVDFRGNGVWPSLYHIYIVVSWLRLQTPIDCIPHIYWMYTKCFSTLRCCGWAYGYTLMPYYMCRKGWVLGKLGYGRACMMLWCRGRGWKHPLTASHIHIGYIQSVWAHLEMLWMGIWVHPYAVPLHVQVGVNFRDRGCTQEFPATQ